MADPGRVGREAFVAEARRLGLSVDERDRRDFEQGAIRQVITLIDVRAPES